MTWWEKSTLNVIPAYAGIRPSIDVIGTIGLIDPGLRRDDDLRKHKISASKKNETQSACASFYSAAT